MVFPAEAAPAVTVPVTAIDTPGTAKANPGDGKITIAFGRRAAKIIAALKAL